MRKVVFSVCGTILLLTTASASLCGQKISLSVLQNGQSTVTEARTLTFDKGAGSTTFPLAAEQFDVDSLALKAMSPGLAITSLSYNESQLSAQSLLKKYVGQNVTLIIPDGATAHGRVQKTATVLTASETPLFVINGEIYAGPYESIRFAGNPDQFISKPSVMFQYMNNGALLQDVRAMYTVSGLSWVMNYSIVADKSMQLAEISGWASIINKSGSSFSDAEIQLIAGNVHSIARPMARSMKAAAIMAMDSSVESVHSEELFEYHAYPIRKKYDVMDQRILKIAILSAKQLKVQSKLIGRANALPSGRESYPLQEPIEAYLSFRNNSSQGLGVPMPQGGVRVSVRQDEQVQPVGEAVLAATPVGATVELFLGKAFDVTVERTAKTFERYGKNGYKCTWQIVIRNSKKTEQVVTLRETLPGKWKISGNTVAYKAVSANSIEFSVNAPPSNGDKATVLEYSFDTEI